MKRHVLKSQIDDWAQKWGKLGKAHGVHHRHVHGGSKHGAGAGHPNHVLDKEFRESLAYFH